MSIVSFSANRVIPVDPHESLADYIDAGGGDGLRAARLVDREVVIAEVEASGLRGRGGAGFPTGTKWRTVVSYESAMLSTAVVVNAAEGEPGTWKDRAILLSNPYAVLEGALIGASVVGARTITVATKQRFVDVVHRLKGAIEEIRVAGWLDDPHVGEVSVEIFEGPEEYLYGEETALLEVLDGRQPFPRIAPPWRRGVIEVVRTPGDVESASGLSADVEMAVQADDNAPPPVLVDNVETLANIPAIVARGATWFRSAGTTESPGTIVCTVTGAVARPAVIEVPMGTSLRSVIELATQGADQSVLCVLMGVSNPILLPGDLDVALTYEAMRERGSGLGSASFIVIDAETHPAALAAGVSRFLAVESCGQCTACKQDGLQISTLLRGIVDGHGEPDHIDRIAARVATVADGARCSLATQHQAVIGSIIRAFGDPIRDLADGGGPPVATYLVAELTGLADGLASVDETFADKQPDWTHAATDSGQAPAERLDEHRV